MTVLEHNGLFIDGPDGRFHRLQTFVVAEQDTAFAMFPIAQVKGAIHFAEQLRAVFHGKLNWFGREG
ncbi:MAG: hypothetical protein IPK99_08725 [Flavobacteriales bacterium]|nr:hypothetical protein [Flavobacteriales bacterium]